MSAQVLRGSKQEIAEKVARMPGEVREVIVLIDEPPNASTLVSDAPSDFQERFMRLVTEWKVGRGHSSKLKDMAMHPAYQQIIGMGERAVPLLMEEMKQRRTNGTGRFGPLRAPIRSARGVGKVARDRGCLDRLGKRKRLHRVMIDYSAFPKLTDTNHRRTSDPASDENCIAHALGARGEWWEPVIGRFWPIGPPYYNHRVDSLVRVYERIGYVACTSAELETEYEKVAIYGDGGEYTRSAPARDRRHLDEQAWSG